MSAFKEASKKHRRIHRERSQPAGRSKFGLLEKKKDYKIRAEWNNKRQETLKKLRKKALNKNPDEFYFKMIRTRLRDGVHQCEDPTPSYTKDQMKLMTSQDLKYVNYKRNVEHKKVERLKGALHMLDTDDKPKNTHIIFTDTKKEAREFDAAKYFDTHPDLVNRTYNRPRLETLKSASFSKVNSEVLENLEYDVRKEYRILGQRIEREKQLNIIAQKMELKKQLMDKSIPKKKIAEGTVTSAAQYKWMKKRKR